MRENAYILVKEASLKRLHVLYFLILIVWHSGKGKTKERIKKNSGFQRFGERDESQERWSEEIFMLVKLFYVIL